MTNEQAAEILRRIDLIAAKLGIAAGELWRILIIQAHVRAWLYSGTAVVLLAGCVGLWIVSTKVWKLENGDEPYWGVPTSIPAGGAIVLFVLALYSVASAVTAFCNPGFVALSILMDMFKQ